MGGGGQHIYVEWVIMDIVVITTFYLEKCPSALFKSHLYNNYCRAGSEATNLAANLSWHIYRYR